MIQIREQREPFGLDITCLQCQEETFYSLPTMAEEALLEQITDLYQKLQKLIHQSKCAGSEACEQTPVYISNASALVFCEEHAPEDVFRV